MVSENDVRASAELIPAAMEKFEAARDAVVAAEAALHAAEHRAEHASHSDDAAELVQAVEDCDRALRRSKVAAVVAASQAASARSHHASVLHHSLENNHGDAVNARIAACKKADDARAAMATALEEFHAATAQLTRIYAAGRVRSFDGAALAPIRATEGWEPPTLDGEKALWGME